MRPFKPFAWLLLSWAIFFGVRGIAQVSITGDDSRIRPVAQQTRAQQRAAQVRAALEHALFGDIVTLGPGLYDFSPNQLRLPPFVTIRGAGMNSTRLTTNWVAVAALGCCFECQNGTILEDVTLESTCGIGEQNEVFGFGGAPTATADLTVSNSTLTLNRVAAIGHSWVLYSWSGANNTINATDCRFVGGRWVVANCRSASGNENLFNLVRCQITVDSSLSTHTGLQGARAAAVVARGGKTFLDACAINVKGDPTLDLAGGVWIDRLDADGGGAHPQTSIDLRRTTVRVTGNGAKEMFDIGEQTGIVTTDRPATGAIPLGVSSGSNADGSFTYQVMAP